jgi:parallel beta-helix repeat protein
MVTNRRHTLNERGIAHLLAALVVLVVFGVIGAVYITLSHAQTTVSPPPAAGAMLPINYSLSAVGGTQRFVATNGNDTSGTGTTAAPYATLAKAISVAANNDRIIVRGGTYRSQSNVTVPNSKTLRILAYPGETPVFNGARAVSGGWVIEGSYRYISYAPRPATDGNGIAFTANENLTGDGIGKYPDQAWIGGTQLKQVSAKSSVVNNSFWVDRTNNRLYLTATDAAKSGIEVSQENVFLTVLSAYTDIEGLTITRYSNTASDYAVVKFAATADTNFMKNDVISDSAFQAISFSGGADKNDGSTMQNVTVSTSNWMGVNAAITDNFTMDAVKINNMNQFGEFSYSPQSGALKTSRTWHTKVLNSAILNNQSHGLWFDQSNYDVHLANSTISGNAGSGVFFEISDRLTMVNNYVSNSSTTTQAVKLAGSSGLRLVNNTIVGGASPLAVFTDSRSKAGCADPAQPLCSGSYSSDRDTYHTHLATLDWIPRVDLMINNIIAYPTGSGACGVTAFCLTQTNSTATVPINTTIHKADSLRPQTVINGNVYANGTGTIFRFNTPLANYTTAAQITSGLAGSPVGIGGMETAGKSGNSYVTTNGTPSSALSSAHSQAAAVPTDSDINKYLPAGTRHYGVTYR